MNVTFQDIGRQALISHYLRQRASSWRNIARPNQIAPEGEWRIWLIKAGRGFGKTRSGGEWVLDRVRQGSRRIALVGPTAADVRDIMVEGESGILAIAPGHEKPIYEPSKRRLTWPNGAMATCYSAEEPDRLRGPQHSDAWADEIAAWKYLQDTWDMLLFGLRLGKDPRLCVTTTPRPLKILKEIEQNPFTVVSRGTSYENKGNLAPAFFSQIIAKYEGTRLGRQEIYGETLEDNPGALWTLDRIDELRLHDAPDMQRVVVAIDPSVTSNEDSDETGIVVAGRAVNGQFYVLGDYSLLASPDGWAREAVRAYDSHSADKVVAETNNGGDLVESVLRTANPDIPYKKITASRGKAVRAEPVAALYEQGRVHHVGIFSKLEDQMCEWVPGEVGQSPDRMDALVWGITELMDTNSKFGMMDAA